MKKLVLISCSAAVTLITAVGIARAVETNTIDSGRRQHRSGHRMHIMRALKEVGVTEAQKDQIRGIMREQRPQLQPLRKQMVEERRALRTAIEASPVNESAIRTQAARVAQVQADLAVKRAQIADRVRGVLTPEQQAKLKEIKAQRDAKSDDERLNRQDSGT
ncbi:MAG: Spy/CpxP family protein refolding chaperone [Chthoniobacterales bacterium]